MSVSYTSHITGLDQRIRSLITQYRVARESFLPAESIISELEALCDALQSVKKELTAMPPEAEEDIVTNPDGHHPCSAATACQPTPAMNNNALYTQQAIDILDILYKPGEHNDLVMDLLGYFKETVGVDAIGLRLHDGNDFTYYRTVGLSVDCVAKGNSLCHRTSEGYLTGDDAEKPVHGCLCKLVISGSADPSWPFFSPGGSFWTNNSVALLAALAEESHPPLLRGRCLYAGFLSMALIPLRSGDEIIGLLQLNSYAPDRFTDESIRYYEKLCGAIGIALERQKYLQLLRENYVKAEMLVQEQTAELRQRNLALRESEVQLRKAKHIAHLGYWEWNARTGEFLLSQEMHVITGINASVISTQAFLEFVHPEDRHLLKHLDQTHPINIDFRIIKPNGELRWLHSEAEIATDMTMRSAKIFGISQDITARKMLEELTTQQREELRGLSLQLTQAQEKERQHIAQELHDNIGQHLTVLGFNLNMIGNQLPVDAPQSIHSLLQDSQQVTNTIGNTIRGVMAELHPPVLDDYGLAAALRIHCNQIIRRTGLLITINTSPDDCRFAPELEMTFFRIAQEALLNIERHAKASRVDISIESLEGYSEMTITDDGIGFDLHAPVRTRENPGWGLLSMRERIQWLGGQLQIASTPGEGTIVIASVRL